MRGVVGLLAGLLALGLFLVAGLAGLMGGYFAWKFFAVYLPNRAWVLECLPSGGTCSIDGNANLELSGISALICLVLFAAASGAGLWLMRRASRG